MDVSQATLHGRPFPAPTYSRVTSVGGDAILTWVRPFCYQDCPEFMLAPELKNGNPLGIMRKINGLFSRKAIK